jgi:hypothetical protein
MEATERDRDADRAVNIYAVNIYALPAIAPSIALPNPKIHFVGRFLHMDTLKQFMDNINRLRLFSEHGDTVWMYHNYNPVIQALQFKPGFFSVYDITYAFNPGRNNHTHVIDIEFVSFRDKTAAGCITCAMNFNDPVNLMTPEEQCLGIGACKGCRKCCPPPR